jgi:hypothetical protein
MLRLLLCYLGSQMTIKWLCLILGITHLPCSQENTAYDCEAFVLLSAHKDIVPERAANAAVCGDDNSP